MTVTITTDEFGVSTPTLRRSARRGAYWIAAVAFALIVALITLAVTGNSQAGDPLSPTNPAPPGAQAVAEVLRDQGVTVTAATSLAQARDAADTAGSPADTTVLLYDPSSFLDAGQLEEVATLGSALVMVDPGFTALTTLAPEIAAAGTASGPFETGSDSSGSSSNPNNNSAGGCRVDAVDRAGTVAGDGSGYRFLGDTAAASLCLGSGDDVFSLIQLNVDGGAADGSTRTVLGIDDVLSNEGVIAGGNAALALGLLGETENLIWYTPSLDDVATETPPSLAELSPGWVVPLMLLVFLVAIAAAIWRGRRFGPLVVERLPVVVRASETMEGRARLYEKNSARLRALDALRIGSVVRLASAVGLPRTAGFDEVVSTVASTINRPDGEVRALLRDADPRTDADLVRLSDQLLLLERAVAGVLRLDSPRSDSPRPDSRRPDALGPDHPHRPLPHRPEEKPAHD